MDFREIPISFECNGATLIGVVHLPNMPINRGVLTVVAGGPQYRGGCCRQLIELARSLAKSGIPVMRFDYRGLGDSEGAFLGFESIESDLRAAIEAFSSVYPDLNEIVLWGGCDAASGILINGWKLPKVTSMILGNPFVSSEETKIAVKRQYYFNRLKQKDFWKKLFSIRSNPLRYTASFIGSLTRRSGPANSSNTKKIGDSMPFQTKMLIGLENFPGPILFLMSGRSLVSKEFDELVSSSARWKKAYDSPIHKRMDLPNADQAFSTSEARKTIIKAAHEWLYDYPTLAGNRNAAIYGSSNSHIT